MPISLNTRYLVYTIDPDGSNAAFTDRTTGQDYLNPAAEKACAAVTVGGTCFPANSAALDGSTLTLGFGSCGISARIAVTEHESYLTWQVAAVEGTPEALEALESFTFLQINLTPPAADDELQSCLLALNLRTDVPELPQPTDQLHALCYPRTGLVGPEAAVIACPPEERRSLMQTVVSAAPDVPHSPLGGPWAWDAPATRGSYMFNFSDLSEETVDDWIALAGQLGINQIDFHGGKSFRFGDCFPNPITYPRGRASLKAVIDKLHAAGILAGLHTYAFFIDKACPWVTPVPDPRLGKDAYFTLAQPLNDTDTRVPVTEPTENMSAITGFFVRNSVTLQIDDELIIYSGINKGAPYAFTGCQRGAYGTRAASHAAEATVGHLKECFGLFVPDNDTMLEQVAASAADMYNACGFDMIYLDALDGEDILGGADYGWHYGSKFVYALFARLNKPPLMEMSTFHHHLWYVRSRIGAWDHPARSHKRFIDLHCEDNLKIGKLFLPGHLGWWSIKTWIGPLGEPTFADDIEYLCGKAIGYGMGISIMGTQPDNVDTVPAYTRMGAIIRQYEALRRADYFGEPIKAALRELGSEFTLIQDDAGAWRLQPAAYTRRTLDLAARQPQPFQADNAFGRQACALRLETLMSAEPYEAEQRVVLMDLGAANEGLTCRAAPGVSVQIDPGEQRLTASNASGSAEGAWACVEHHCEPLDLSAQQGLGVWVEGDGQGEILNVQLKSPEHLTPGIADHYIVLDFTGWRYFTLVEPEGERYSQYTWPYGHYYTIYRENVDYRHIDTVSLWYNNIPTGSTVSCRIKPVMALPLAAGMLVNPTISDGMHALRLPVSIASGCYLEYQDAANCILYGPQGEELERITPQGSAPMLDPGANTLTIQADAPARVRLTVSSRGEPLS